MFFFVRNIFDRSSAPNCDFFARLAGRTSAPLAYWEAVDGLDARARPVLQQTFFWTKKAAWRRRRKTIPVGVHCSPVRCDWAATDDIGHRRRTDDSSRGWRQRRAASVKHETKSAPHLEFKDRIILTTRARVKKKRREKKTFNGINISVRLRPLTKWWIIVERLSRKIVRLDLIYWPIHCGTVRAILKIIYTLCQN